MPISPRHSRSVFYEQDYLVPRTARPLFVPIGTECLRTHVKEAPGLTFISTPTLAGSLLPAFVHSRFRMSPVLFWFTQRSRRRGSPSSTKAIECRRFCQRSPCTFSRSCLTPRGKENEIIMLRGAQVCRWAIVHTECILPNAFLFENNDGLDATNFEKTLKKWRNCVILFARSILPFYKAVEYIVNHIDSTSSKF